MASRPGDGGRRLGRGAQVKKSELRGGMYAYRFPTVNVITRYCLQALIKILKCSNKEAMKDGLTARILTGFSGQLLWFEDFLQHCTNFFFSFQA